MLSYTPVNDRIKKYIENKMPLTTFTLNPIDGVPGKNIRIFITLNSHRYCEIQTKILSKKINHNLKENDEGRLVEQPKDMVCLELEVMDPTDPSYHMQIYYHFLEKKWIFEKKEILVFPL